MPPDYERYFQSFDGKARKLIVEGAGGPSWFTEYNVLTGLSALSFGRFATSVTRIAAGRIRQRTSKCVSADLTISSASPEALSSPCARAIKGAISLTGIGRDVQNANLLTSPRATIAILLNLRCDRYLAGAAPP